MKRSGLLQIQLGLNAQVLSGLYNEHRALKMSRKMYNERADECFKQMRIADDNLDFDASHQHNEQGMAAREQAAVFTPYIKKFAKRTKAIEQVQKALKQELRNAQAVEAWQVREDAEWLQLAQLAQQEDYRVTYSYDQLAEMFKEQEE